MARIITFIHTKKSKPIGKVISVTRMNDELVVVWRKKESNIMKQLKPLFWLIFIYILLAVIFNWWPINILGWPL